MSSLADLTSSLGINCRCNVRRPERLLDGWLGGTPTGDPIRWLRGPSIGCVPDPRIPDDLPVVVEQQRTPHGRSWLQKLPGLLDSAVERWDIELGEPFRAGSAAWVAPVRRRDDDSECVLKITLPHREARYEGAGLRVWNGDGAVRLLAEDVDGYALLVERCRPGTQLQTDPSPKEERLTAAAELATRLWRRPVPEGSPFETVEVVCAEWALLVRQRMDELRPAFDAGLVETGARLLEDLPSSATRCVLIHGDFNPTNILRAEREAWLAIDAKPMLGDPGYDPSPLVIQIGFGAGDAPNSERLRRDFELFATVVGEPLDRLFAWATAREVESALWNTARDAFSDASENMVWARVLADLTGL